MAKSSEYRKMERKMSLVLIADLLLFVLYLIAAGNGVIWAKVLLSILIILLSAAILGFLYLTQELRKRRSVWMTAASGAILICTLVSLLLNFPRPQYTLPGIDPLGAPETTISSDYVNP